MNDPQTVMDHVLFYLKSFIRYSLPFSVERLLPDASGITGLILRTAAAKFSVEVVYQ